MRAHLKQRLGYRLVLECLGLNLMMQVRALVLLRLFLQQLRQQMLLSPRPRQGQGQGDLPWAHR